MHRLFILFLKFLSSPLKDLIYVTLPPEIEVKRDGIAVFFTLISTGYTFEIALKLLKHFTMTGFTDVSFTELKLHFLYNC